jgi:hypothetical protein
LSAFSGKKLKQPNAIAVLSSKGKVSQARGEIEQSDLSGNGRFFVDDIQGILLPDAKRQDVPMMQKR